MIIILCIKVSSGVKNPTIEVYIVTADYYYPDRGCLFDFLPFGVEKLLTWQGIEQTTLDLSSQSGAFEL